MSPAPAPAPEAPAGRTYGSGPGMVSDPRHLRPGDLVTVAGRFADDPNRTVTVVRNHGADGWGFTTLTVDDAVHGHREMSV